MKASRKTQSSKPPVSLVLLPFTVPANLAETVVCGGYDKKFKTAVTLTVADLDQDGFVIENMSFIGEVKNRFRDCKYKASCEELGLGIVNIAHEMVGKRLTAAHVKVYNLTGYTEVLWTKGQKVPPFPRHARIGE